MRSEERVQRDKKAHCRREGILRGWSLGSRATAGEDGFWRGLTGGSGAFGRGATAGEEGFWRGPTGGSGAFGRGATSGCGAATLGAFLEVIGQEVGDRPGGCGGDLLLQKALDHGDNIRRPVRSLAPC